MIPFLFLDLAYVGTLQKTVKDFWEIFEVTKFSKGRDIRSQGFGVVMVKPKSSGIEAFTIGLAGTTDAAEVTDKFKGGEWVIGPC